MRAAGAEKGDERLTRLAAACLVHITRDEEEWKQWTREYLTRLSAADPSGKLIRDLETVLSSSVSQNDEEDDLVLLSSLEGMMQRLKQGLELRCEDDHDRRRCEDFVACFVCSNASSKNYDARARTAAKLMCAVLGLPLAFLPRAEARVPEMKALQLEQPPEKLESHTTFRLLKITLTALGSGALIYYSGGLAAPSIIASCLALGTATSSLGSWGAALSAYLGAYGSTGIAYLPASMSVYGAGMAGYKMARRTSALTEFQMLPLHAPYVDEPAGNSDELVISSRDNEGLPVFILVSGWFEESTDPRDVWGGETWLVPSPASVKPSNASSEQTAVASAVALEQSIDGSQAAEEEAEGNDADSAQEQSRSIFWSIWDIWRSKKPVEGDHAAQHEPEADAERGQDEEEEEEEKEEADAAVEPIRRDSSDDEMPAPIAVVVESPAIVESIQEVVSDLKGALCESGLLSASMCSEANEKEWEALKSMCKHSWWRDSIPGGEEYVLVWEPKLLNTLFDSARNFLWDEACGYAMDELLKRTALSTVMAAASWPLAVISRASSLDNPWALSLHMAREGGAALASLLMHAKQTSGRPVTLMGFSMGARLIFHCLEALARAGPAGRGIVENVVLCGTPISTRHGKWQAVREVVANRLVNCYSSHDWFLAFMYRSKTFEVGVAGVNAVKFNDHCTDVPIQQYVSGEHQVDVHTALNRCLGVENVDVSELVHGHFEYPNALSYVVSALHLEV